jgi:two-component system chemotaxis sensor kinase CheA
MMSQNILLVDDRQENLLLLESLLEEENREFLKAESGEEALKILLKHDVALILLDVQMPGMDGYETAALIRGSLKTKHIPIIFVTAISKEQKHIFKGYESGAVDFMFKPVDSNIMKSKVKVFLELDQKRKTVELKNKELQAVKKNTDNILENVINGLFLLDRDYIIKPQYSLALEEIFMQKDLGNQNFINFLDKKLSAKLKTTSEDYLEIMFRSDTYEEMLEDLNPMHEIEFEFKANPNDVSVSKVLSFTFKRIYDAEDEISELIATVTDITEKIRLAKKLKESEAYSKKQMEWIFNVLFVEPQLLREFIESVQKELYYIDDVLKQSEKGQDYQEGLVKIFRSMHLIKGNASLLNLKFFVSKAHEFEEKILIVQKKSKIQGPDFVSLVLLLVDMQGTLSEINNLIDRIGNIHTHFQSMHSNESKSFIQSLQNLINNTAGELNKKIRFEHKKFDAGIIPYQYRLSIKEIIIQLVRNAIYHGIESPDDRINMGKNASGSIEMSSFVDKNSFGFIIKDDGRGLQIKKLREKAKTSGKWKKYEIEKWDEKQITDTIFISGISTLERADFGAGRGVGMDIVKEKVNNFVGEIAVNYEYGQFCEFIITLPFDKENFKLSQN